MILKHLDKIYRSPDFHYDRKQFVRLDKNERVEPFSKKTLNDIKKFVSSDILQSYPSNKKTLVNLISKAERINSRYINVIPGSDAGIKYIFEIFASKTKRAMASIFPTYGMVDVYTKIYKYQFHKLLFDENLENNIKKLLKKRISFIYIANPNQPTGKYLDKKKMLNIIKIAKKKNIFVVLDEAYIDFSRFKSMSVFVKKFNNLIVLKTFSKSYGLAGLRIGYLIANKKFNKVLNCVRSTFDVSHFSIKVAEYILKNEKIKSSYIGQVKKSKKFLINECKKRNLKYKDTETNFFYIRVPNSKIRKIYKFMFKNKILIRTNFLGNFKYLNNSIRITVGDIYLMKFFLMFFDKIYKESRI